MNVQTQAASALIQPEFILGTAELNRACETIQEKGQKLDDFIQYTALSVLNHVMLHGDVTVVNKLYASMPKGSRKSALVEFLLQHGKLVAETDRMKSKTAPFLFAKGKEVDPELVAAKAKPWYDHKKDPVVADMLDIQAMIKQLVGRIEREEQKGSKIEGEHSKLLADLKLLSERPVATTQAAPATVQ